MKIKEGGGCDVMSDAMGWKGEIENVYFFYLKGVNNRKGGREGGGGLGIKQEIELIFTFFLAERNYFELLFRNFR